MGKEVRTGHGSQFLGRLKKIPKAYYNVQCPRYEEGDENAGFAMPSVRTKIRQKVLIIKVPLYGINCQPKLIHLQSLLPTFKTKLKQYMLDIC